MSDGEDTTAVVEPAKYPFVIRDQVEHALVNAQQLGPDVYKKTLSRIDKMMEMPQYQYRPLPMALQFHKSVARYRWCLGGNRSSKSHSVAHEVFFFATGTHPYRNIKVPNVGWYCTLTWELVGTILWDKMRALLYFDDGTQRIPHEVRWRNRGSGIPASVSIPVGGGQQSTIIFKAYEQGSAIFQGTERRYIANDEQFPQDIYTEQISRIGSGDQLDFFAAMTPIKAQPWLESRLGDSSQLPSSWAKFEFPLDDNRISRGGFIPDTEIDQLIDEWPEEVQPTRRMGKWASYLGAVYKGFNRMTHVVTPERRHEFFPRDEKPDSWDRCVGALDWGGNNPFAFLWAMRVPCMDNEWYVFDEYYWDYQRNGVRLIRDHAAEIISRTKRWGLPLSRVWADHDAQDVMEAEACGLMTNPAIKDVIAGIEQVQKLLKVSALTNRPRLHVDERCTMTIQQMATLRWPEGSDTHDPSDVPVKHEDHCPDALRYIMYSEAQLAPPTTERIVMNDQFQRKF